VQKDRRVNFLKEYASETCCRILLTFYRNKTKPGSTQTHTRTNIKLHQQHKW